MSRYGPGTGPAGRSCTTPPAVVARATVRRSASVGTLPARSSMSAPGMLPSVIWALVIVTGRPMSRISPVPARRLPNVAVAYQLVCQGVAGCPASASGAFCGLSPCAVPPGPNAAALAGVSVVTGGADAVAEGVAECVARGSAVAGPARRGAPPRPRAPPRPQAGREPQT